MINSTSIKVPKKYQSMIDEIYKDADGYWCYAKEGFYFPCMDCGTAHEDTQRELLQVIRTIKKI